MSLIRRLNRTYQKVYRDRHLLAQGLSLTDPEYRLWDLFKALEDWDKNHSETYQKVLATDRELVKVLPSSYWSPSKVCRVRKSLITKGFIDQTGTSEYKVIEMSLVQQRISQVKQKIAPVQQKQTYNGNSSLVSYKDKYSLVRSNKEYEELWEENGRPESFTPEDMKWVDRYLEN